MKSFLPLAMGISVLLGSIVSDHGLAGLLKARQQSRQLATEVAALKADNAVLRMRVDELKHDPAAIERVARRDFGLVRPDELVITVERALP